MLEIEPETFHLLPGRKNIVNKKLISKCMTLLNSSRYNFSRKVDPLQVLVYL